MTILDNTTASVLRLPAVKRGERLDQIGDMQYQDGLTDEPVEVMVLHDGDPDDPQNMFIVGGEFWAGIGFTPREAADCMMKAKKTG